MCAASCKRCSVQQARTQHVEGLRAQDPVEGRAGCLAVKVLARASLWPAVALGLLCLCFWNRRQDNAYKME